MGIFDSLDSADGDDGEPGRHWLDGWRVQLPVDKQGRLSGAADQNWRPANSYKPWYVIRGREISFRRPKTGAETKSAVSTRCELNQLTTWSDGTIAFDVDVKKTSPRGTIIYQCRSGEDGDELIQLRAYKDEGTFKVQMGPAKWPDNPVDFGRKVRVKAEIKRNKTVTLWVNGEKFEANMRNKTYGRNRFNHKIGLYGGGAHPAESKVTNLTWS